jgi:hypothetical protein
LSLSETELTSIPFTHLHGEVTLRQFELLGVAVSIRISFEVDGSLDEFMAAADKGRLWIIEVWESPGKKGSAEGD